MKGKAAKSKKSGRPRNRALGSALEVHEKRYREERMRVEASITRFDKAVSAKDCAGALEALTDAAHGFGRGAAEVLGTNQKKRAAEVMGSTAGQLRAGRARYLEVCVRPAAPRKPRAKGRS